MGSFLYGSLSHSVLGACFSVHNILGPGLLESAFEGALVIELAHLGIPFERQKVYPVYYKGELAGAYIVNTGIKLQFFTGVKLQISGKNI